MHQCRKSKSEKQMKKSQAEQKRWEEKRKEQKGPKRKKEKRKEKKGSTRKNEGGGVPKPTLTSSNTEKKRGS